MAAAALATQAAAANARARPRLAGQCEKWLARPNTQRAKPVLGRPIALALPADSDGAAGGAASSSLFQRCARLSFSAIRSGAPPLLQLALLRLLIAWVCDCAEAAAAFCGATANLPAVLDAIAQPALDVHVRGG